MENRCHDEDEQPTPLEQLTAQDHGLEIITRKSKRWLRVRMNQNDLAEALRNGTFKWKYTDNSITEIEMYNYIINNEC